MTEVLQIITEMSALGYPAQVILDALRLRAEAEQAARDDAMSAWEEREAERAERASF
jgi:DNA-binding transcriptional MerR regulator